MNLIKDFLQYIETSTREFFETISTPTLENIACLAIMIIFIITIIYFFKHQEKLEPIEKLCIKAVKYFKDKKQVAEKDYRQLMDVPQSNITVGQIRQLVSEYEYIDIKNLSDGNSLMYEENRFLKNQYNEYQVNKFSISQSRNSHHIIIYIEKDANLNNKNKF